MRPRRVNVDRMRRHQRRDEDDLVAELVRRGALIEESRSRLLWAEDDDPGNDDPALVLAGHANEVRLVTEWVEVSW